MKHSLKYLKLWQKKQNELPVSADLQSDWQDMQQLLDKHLPVSKPLSGHSNAIKGLAIKPIVAALLVVSSVAVIYFAADKSHIKPKKNKTEAKDTVKQVVIIDSSKTNQSIYNTGLTDSSYHHDTTAAVNNNVAKTSEPNTLNVQSLNNGVDGNAPALPNKGGKVVKNQANKPPMTKNNREQVEKYTNNGQQGLVTPVFEPRITIAKTDTNYIIPKDNSPLGAAQSNNDMLISQKPHNETSRNAETSHPGSALSGSSKIKMNRVKRGKNSKTKPTKDTFSLTTDWGVLMGTNTAGITKIPADLFFGAFTTFNTHYKWSINAQVRAFSVQNVSGSYTHAAESIKFNNLKTISINDSRKIYSLQVPVYLEYKASKAISLKAGPVLSLPIRQTNGNSLLQPDSIRKDTAYHSQVLSQLNNTTYQRRINYGISAGASISIDRFIFEAAYLKRLNAQKVISPLGSYSSSGNTFQITVGIKLNKPRR